MTNADDKWHASAPNLARMGMNIWQMFVIGKLYANSLLASMNPREHLRSQNAGSRSDSHSGTVHFANLSKLVGEVESPKDGTRRTDASNAAVINVTTVSAAALRTEGEV
ncbi:hypothetical protein EV401DRAFT_2200372 [Pisolithus croceorrhizus]|nr:hypothetical protein EV401DRAFT_2200372 [Pisolithus croceorrhizus]